MSTENPNTNSESESIPVPDWDHVPTNKDSIKFVSTDRTQTVICTPVSTAGGEVYNCVLYKTDTPYNTGQKETSTIATTRSSIPQTLQSEFSSS